MSRIVLKLGSYKVISVYAQPLYVCGRTVHVEAGEGADAVSDYEACIQRQYTNPPYALAQLIVIEALAGIRELLVSYRRYRKATSAAL